MVASLSVFLTDGGRIHCQLSFRHELEDTISPHLLIAGDTVFGITVLAEESLTPRNEGMDFLFFHKFTIGLGNIARTQYNIM